MHHKTFRFNKWIVIWLDSLTLCLEWEKKGDRKEKKNEIGIRKRGKGKKNLNFYK